MKFTGGDNSFTFFHKVGGKDLIEISSSLKLWNLHPNMSHQFILSQVHCYWRWALCFSTTWKQIDLTRRGERKKKKTPTPKCVPEGNTVNREIPRTGTRKYNETDFDSEAAIPGERQLVPFAWRSPCSFCHYDVFPWEWRVVISHPPHSLDLAPADLLMFLTVKTSLKESRIQDTGKHQAKGHH